jgi:tetratricopeptide (TPR) repeat protein
VNPREQVEQGRAALEKGDYAGALKIFEELISGIQASTDPVAYQFLPFAQTGRGRALAGLNDNEGALDDYKKVLDENPDFVDALVSRGELYLKLNLNEDALIDFTAALSQQRGNLPAQFGFAKATVLLGGADQAIKPLTRVIEAAPENAEAYQLRGRAYNGAHKIKEAIADLEKAISINPEDHDAYFWLGAVRLRTKEYRDAAEQFRKAIEHYKPKPGMEGVPYFEGHLTRAAALIELGKVTKDKSQQSAAYKESLEECNRIIGQIDELNPNYAAAHAAALFSRGVAERMVGDYGSAIKSFTKAIELNPDLGDAYFRRGICLHMIGEDRMAISDFQTAANLNPFDDPRSNMWEGFTYAKLGEYYEALRAYGNAIAASDRYTPAYVNRGLAYMALGEHEKAIRDFNDAIRLEPTKADYYFKRGVAFEQLGDHDKAAESFTAALQFDKAHTGARAHLRSLGRSALAVQ